jgi:hypothetical protein
MSARFSDFAAPRECAMILSHLRMGLIAWAVSSVVVGQAFAQNANYTSVETTWDKPVQLGYHASAHKNCTPARLPTIRVLEAPKSGTMSVRGAVLTMNKLPGCPPVKTPARVVFYQARAGYVGPDHLNYEVTSESGEVSTYDFAITVKAPPNPPQTAKGAQPL